MAPASACRLRLGRCTGGGGTKGVKSSSKGLEKAAGETFGHPALAGHARVSRQFRQFSNTDICVGTFRFL